jgi:hypothetical protein
VCQNKLEVLSRTYPQIVAGTIVDYSYQVKTRAFALQFHPWSGDQFTQAKEEGRKSEVYVNRELSYPHGLAVAVTASDSSDVSTVLSYKCPSPLEKALNYNLLEVTQVGAADPAVTYKVEVHACTPLNKDQCSCR